MAHGTILSECLRFALFGALGLVLPALGIFRLLRLPVDLALLLPLGLVTASLSYFLSLRCHAPWLFVVLVGAPALAALVPPFRFVRAPGASLLGTLPALGAIVLLFATTEFPMNRVGSRGEFVFDNVVPEDTTFHVGLAWELSAFYPPDVPGLSGVPMGYHLGLPLVRAAAIRFAGLHPYDLMSRFEIVLVAWGLMLLLREAALRLGAPPLALALVPWTLVATDFSFVYFRNSSIDFWINATDSNLLFSLCHANSSVAAIVVALGALLALERYVSGEGRAFLPTAVLLAAAVPHFKVFVGCQFLFGLGICLVATRRVRESLLLGVPAAIGILVLALGPGGSNMQVGIVPLLIVQKFRTTLGAPPAQGVALVASTLLWLVTSLGLRLVGIRGACRGLLSRQPLAAALSGMALLGWPLGMLFRIVPIAFPGRAPYNEAWYFIEQSAPFLWLFAVLALVRIPLRPAFVVLGAALLTLPSTLQFALAKSATPAVHAPPAIVEAMGALAEATSPGEVVLERPEPKRFPPPPMVLIGRRVPYSRYIPYLYQVAPQEELKARIEEVRRFFKTEDPRIAVDTAKDLGARFVCLYGDDQVAFRAEGTLRPLYEKDNTRVYEVVGAGTR
jgi:hypothetical protein